MSTNGAPKQDSLTIRLAIHVARSNILASALIALAMLTSNTHAEVREYHLTIAEGSVIIDGTARKALTINGTVPGPVLRFTIGDEAVIHVHNTMRESTSLHWHGLLLPNDQGRR